MKYRVVAGTHEDTKRVYKKGEIVTSDKDLIKLFPNKFVEASAREADAIVDVDAPGDEGKEAEEDAGDTEEESEDPEDAEGSTEENPAPKPKAKKSGKNKFKR